MLLDGRVGKLLEERGLELSRHKVRRVDGRLGLSESGDREGGEGELHGDGCMRVRTG